MGIWIILAIALIIFAGLSFLDEIKIGNYTLQKAPFKETLLSEKIPESPYVETAEIDSLTGKAKLAEPDTTVKSILIFGDSMTILIANRMAAYGKQNGYKVTSVTWDSSSSVGWSGCDTLENYIRIARPDFIMVTLGSNELFLQNFDRRSPYIKKLIDKIGDIPFVWIGPPNWKDDKGFNDMMVRTLPPGTYFRTEGMTLQRGPDHVHPTPAAGALWTDSIMRWIKTSPHPILSEFPDSAIGKPGHNAYYLKAQ